MKKVTFPHATYLGGLPGDKGGYGGNLIATDVCLGMGVTNPKKSPVRWADMAGISFDSETAAKSRAGKVLLVGVFALAAKNTQSRAVITASLKDGNTALWQVTGKSGAEVRGKLQAFLTASGVACLDDSVPVAAAAPTSTADELVKLVSLRDSGVLTDEEFAAQKSKLLT